MTTMIIDNKAGKGKRYESYTIDRSVYPEEKDLEELVWDCMNENVYMITVEVDGNELLRKYNIA